MLMKKKLSLLMVALIAVAAFAMQVTKRAYSDPSPYSYAFSTSEKTFSGDGTMDLGGVDWTLAVTWTDDTKKDYNRDGDGGGMKIGSNSKSVTAMSLTSDADAFGANYITSVKVTTAARSGANPALTVTVGGAEFKYVKDDQKLSSAPVGTDKTAVYEFAGVGQGAIVINWDGSKSSSKGAIYVKQIDVAFQAEAPAGPAVAEPVFSLDGGTYAGAQSVEITCATDGASIFYTTDGTAPTAESTAYTGAISVTETTTIKAIGIKGEDKSEVATSVYTIVEKIDGGSLSPPLTIAHAKALIDTKAGAALEHPDNKVYVKAVATVGEATVDTYGQLTYKLSEGTDEFDVYQGKNLENVAFTEDTKGDIDGKLVTVYGNIKKYNESYEFDRGNYVVKVEIAPADVTVEAADITDGDITAAIAAKAAGAPVKNLTINLAAGAYTVSAPIVAGGNVVINGNGATVDASALAGNFIEMAATYDQTDQTATPTKWTVADIAVKNVTIKGLKKALFYSTQKMYVANDFTIDNCVVELAADATTFDYTKGSTAVNLTVTNSTFYAPAATTKSFYSSQSGQKTTEYNAEAVQTFTFTNNTLYNLAPTKNFFTHRQANQKWLAYNVKNNIFVNCGKSGQVIKGMNGGQSGMNPTWTIDGNLFNFNGADTGAAEDTGDAEEPVQNSVAGVVTFTDAAAGNFDAVLGTEFAPVKPTIAVGDPRWIVNTKQIPSDITIGATELEAAANDISAALATAATGKIVGNLTVNLAADGAYKVTAPIEAGASIIINGAAGATIDASALTAPFIALSAEPTAPFLPKNDGTGDTDYYGIDKVDINNVKVTGLKNSIFWDSNKKYCVVDFKIDNCVFALATEAVQNEALIAFQAGGAKDFTVKNSTISGNNAVAKYFVRYNNAARIDRYGFLQATDTWSFTYENNTFYGLLNSDGQWGNYNGLTQKTSQFVLTINNNIWVDCDAQTMRRLNHSKNFSAFNAASAMANNVFNREGAVVDQGSYSNGSDLKGVVTFTDAAAGNFNGKIKLAPGTVAPATIPGDTEWTLTTEATKLYIIGDMNGWNRTAMTEMTFNAETQTFEYEYAPTTVAHLAFADYQMTEDEAAAEGSWDVFNSTYRYAIGEKDQDVTLNSPMALLKVNGTLTLQPVKSGTSYTITVAADFSTVTITGEAEPAPTVEKLYIMGTGTPSEWSNTTEMTFNEATQAFEYEVTNNDKLYITFGDAAFTNWDDWNANNRIAIGPDNQDAPVGTEFDLIKANGTLVLEAGSYKISVTKTLKCTITTTTGINAVKADALKDAQIYTISGQRVDKAQKGLYIVNGKKVVVK